MRNRGYLILCVASTAVLLTGCGGKGKNTVLDPKNPVTVTMWNNYTGAQQDAFNDLVAEFNENRGKELGVYVKASSEGSVTDVEQYVLEAAEKKVGARELPNIFTAYSDTVYTVDQMGLIEDLGPYFTDEEKEAYVEGYLQEGMFGKDGELKIFPVAKATEVFALNTTDWDKFAQATGASKDSLSTLEGVVETAEAYYKWTDSLTPEEGDGKAFYGRDSMANYMIIGAAQLGHPIYEKAEDGQVQIQLEEETARKLWDAYYVPYINGYFTSAGRFRSDDMKTGALISFAGSSAGATFFPEEVFLNDEESYPIELEILPVPGFEGGTGCAVQQGAGMAVTKGTEAEIAGSVEFLKWFTDTEQNVRFSVESGYLPVKKKSNDMELIKKSLDGKETTIRTMEVAIETILNDGTAYPLAMENAGTVRNLLEYSMSDKAAADREAVIAAMEKGTSREEAVAVFDTDENFRQWYQEISEKLEATVK